MRRATPILLLLMFAALTLVPTGAQSQSGQQIRVINAIGLVDYYQKPTFKPGDWVRYHMTGSSELGMKDDYVIIVTIAGEEEFWGEDCFWVETVSVQDSVEVASVASLVSYAVFDDPEAITKMRTYVRKQISSMTESGEPIQEVMRRPMKTLKRPDPKDRKLEYYIDSLGTETVETEQGFFECTKIMFKQAAGASREFADSSRYDETRENRTIYRTTRVPVTSILIEEIENVVLRKTWMPGESAEADTIIRDRALGRAVATDWGTGRKSLIIPEHLQKPLTEQRARARRRAGSG